jgi:hypothetical protein
VLPPLVDTPATANVKGKKMAPGEVAAVTLEALALRRPIALPGQTKLLPLMLRIAPDTVKRIVAEPGSRHFPCKRTAAPSVIGQDSLKPVDETVRGKSPGK